MDKNKPKVSPNDGDFPSSPRDFKGASPVNRFPGILCVDSEALEIEDEYSLINCERYVLSTDGTKFACQKCIPGYHGLMTKFDEYADTTDIPEIKNCKKMSSCDNPTMSGLSYRSDYDMSKLGINLEAFASCGQCTDVNKIMFTNVTYHTPSKSLQKFYVTDELSFGRFGNFILCVVICGIVNNLY